MLRVGHVLEILDTTTRVALRPGGIQLTLDFQMGDFIRRSEPPSLPFSFLAEIGVFTYTVVGNEQNLKKTLLTRSYRLRGQQTTWVQGEQLTPKLLAM